MQYIVSQLKIRGWADFRVAKNKDYFSSNAQKYFQEKVLFFKF
jgi:hypothetical protein